ncbi:cysteine--tRNA ligase [Bdellovibrio sp. qaytius]|nr:cysteine--tRNA ligase [Bdellovibrio sp. qaytius]
MLKIYSTLTKKTEEFKPMKPGHVSIYVCGPTVYSYLHVGNFRGPVFFNFVRNWFEYLGYKVDYALNFTDVDDKIIDRATEEGKSAKEISEHYIKEYKKDFSDLGLRAHDHNPKVSEYMPQIIEFIGKLIENDKAYALNGDVNYAVDKFANYGQLSGRKLEDMQVGVRIEANDKKNHPLDFALWKSKKPNETLQGSSWPSPWGEGRPGWHIECSAMVHGLYGDQIDIHGGGLDLVFPHHENEIAQSEGCTGKHYVNYWMHWNLLNFGGSKMSKSLGNIINMRTFLEEHHPEIYKWMMLSSHYRSVGEFSDATIDLAVSGLARVYSALALADSFINDEAQEDAKYQVELDAAWEKIIEHINDDFSTPQAFAVMFDQIRKFNGQFKRGAKTNATLSGRAQQFKSFVMQFGKLLALFQMPAEKFLRALDQKLLTKAGIDEHDVESLVLARSLARQTKDYAKSDEIRAKLTQMNILVSDTPDGSFWEVNK